MCNCRSREDAITAAAAAAARVFHYVHEADGTYTGRRYTSLLDAEHYRRLKAGREIRTKKE